MLDGEVECIEFLELTDNRGVVLGKDGLPVQKTFTVRDNVKVAVVEEYFPVYTGEQHYLFINCYSFQDIRLA